MDEISLHGGGCALNTATGLARFGLSVLVVGKVGEDTFGDFVVGLLDERGLDTRGVLRDPAVPTSATVVLVDRAGERSFLHLPGANGALGAEELAPEIFAGRALHVAGALVMPALDGAPTAGLLAEARRRGVHTSLDTVYDATGRWDAAPAVPATPRSAHGRPRRGAGDLGRARACERRCLVPRPRRRGGGAEARPRRVLRRGRRVRGRRTRVSRRRRRRHRGRRRFRRRASSTGDSRAGHSATPHGSPTPPARSRRLRSARPRVSSTSTGHWPSRASGRRRERPAEPAVRRRRPLLRRRRRPRLLRRGRVPRRDRGHGAGGRDARRGGAGRDPALTRRRRR